MILGPPKSRKSDAHLLYFGPIPNIPDPGLGGSTFVAENDGARPSERLREAADMRNRSERAQGSPRDTADRSGAA